MKKSGKLAKFYLNLSRTNELPNNWCRFTWNLIWSLFAMLITLPTYLMTRKYLLHTIDLTTNNKITHIDRICALVIFVLNLLLIALIAFLSYGLHSQSFHIAFIIIGYLVVDSVFHKFYHTKILYEFIIKLWSYINKNIISKVCPKINWKD